MNKFGTGVVVFTFLMTLACYNPFLPPTDIPENDLNRVENIGSRSTPENVIDQLFQSYESKNLTQFTDLLSKDYRFYIASGFDQTNNNFSTKYGGILHSERPDSFMMYVNTSDLYYYWGYEAEVHSHNKLFSNAELITIPSRPQISEIHYIFNSTGDTVNAEVRIKNVTFEVSVFEESTITPYTVSNQDQVFLLEKDTSKLWVIKKWYDLGRES